MRIVEPMRRRRRWFAGEHRAHFVTRRIYAALDHFPDDIRAADARYFVPSNAGDKQQKREQHQNARH